MISAAMCVQQHLVDSAPDRWRISAILAGIESRTAPGFLRLDPERNEGF